MNVFRCLGLLVVVLLSGCDAPDTSVPKPKAEAVITAPVSPEVHLKTEAPAQAVATDAKQIKAPDTMHQLMPGVPVVPVVVGKEKSEPAAPQSVKSATSEKTSSRVVAAKAPASKRKNAKDAKTASVKDVRIKAPRLDLSLPPELVKELDPPAKVITNKRKPILPQMFSDKGDSANPGPFELEGRLLTNEMQLQMRNDNRRDVEGAALDFKFKQ
ncbi:translation initiation factor 2 [Pseudomonas syringae]|uniref:Translation initiation factor 2 n=1 Tax=Pseudomonas syringae UB303 TaxID=1357287 RepID=A0AAJ4B588_PSESX|nr:MULTISPECIES: translation initiation factor 2 [Pseudomonas]QHF07764.1 translation initiation factor 2 [Pseudomonas syringae UB303]RXT86879.1 translation initiation factor 2 [Pseudomonas syringae]SOP98178.1 translation initiation factor 2 [Pseudomonas syringae pv. syringae]